MSCCCCLGIPVCGPAPVCGCRYTFVERRPDGLLEAVERAPWCVHTMYATRHVCAKTIMEWLESTHQAIGEGRVRARKGIPRAITGLALELARKSGSDFSSLGLGFRVWALKVWGSISGEKI